MSFKTIVLLTSSFFSLVFIIACGAQNDSLRINEAFIEELINDPLTEQVKTIQQNQTDLIMFNSLNMDALTEILKNTPDHDPCKITADLSKVKHAVEYFDNMCIFITGMNQLNVKYPQLRDLDSDARLKIFFTSEPVTTQDVLLILESRNKID